MNIAIVTTCIVLDQKEREKQESKSYLFMPILRTLEIANYTFHPVCLYSISFCFSKRYFPLNVDISHRPFPGEMSHGFVNLKSVTY